MVFRRLLLLFFISIPFFSTQLFADLIDIYNKDYEIINRTVIVTTKKPAYKIDNLEKKIIVRIDSISKSALTPSQQILTSPVVENIQVDKADNNSIIVTISVKGQYYLEHFYLGGERERIVLDIYRIKEPRTLSELVAFTNFYTTVGYYRRAEPLILQVQDQYSQYTGINYYRAKFLINQKETSKAIDILRTVEIDQPEYLLSQIELMKLGAIEFSFDSQTTEAFQNYRDYFLSTNNSNQQQLLVALVSTVFGNYQLTKELLAQVDENQTETKNMLNNMLTICEQIGNDKDIQKNNPFIAKTSSQVFSSKRTILSSNIFSLILLIIFAVIYITTVIILKKKKAVARASAVSQDIQPEHTEQKYEEPPKGCPDNESTLSAGTPETEQSNNEGEDKARTRNESDSSDIEDDITDDRINPASISDNELRQKLALKLFNEGWKVKSIAKELNTTEAEVEWFLTH